jgi:hypothetical protein
MKKLILAIAVVIGFTSCEKTEVPNLLQDRFVNASNPIPARRLTLDLLNVHWVGKSASNQFAFTPEGYRYEFTETNEQYSVLVQVNVDGSGEVKNITGRLNGHSFIMWDGVVNICGGQQGVPISYSLK